jgi:hypothetical protein
MDTYFYCNKNAGKIPEINYLYLSNVPSKIAVNFSAINYFWIFRQKFK